MNSDHFRSCSALVLPSLLAMTSAARGQNLEHYGYYYTDGAVYGHYMDKTIIPGDSARLHEYTNLAHIDIGLHQHANPRRAIIDAVNLGYKLVIYGASGFEKDTPGTWQPGLNEIQGVVSGYEDFVYAVELVDEPDGRGWSRAQIESLVDQAKTYFNNSMPITVNLDIPAIQPPPRNMDLYMFDYYVNGGLTHTTKAQYDAAMNGIISAIRTAAPGKPIFILGSSFSDNTTTPYQGWHLPTAEQTQWYVDTANNTPEVTGLMWYTLGNPYPPNGSYGAITYPTLLNQHKQIRETIVTAPEGLVLDDRFDTYANQGEVSAVYSGYTPLLRPAKDHGNNGGKSLQFDFGSEMATRQLSAHDRPGSAEAFLFDLTSNAADCIGFRAVSEEGNSIAIYARGGNAKYLLTDEANGVVGLQTSIDSLAHWQKVEFVFDGAGVKAFADSLLVYEAAGGWEGGFSKIGFYDPFNSNGFGYIDDIRAFQEGLLGDFNLDSKVDAADIDMLIAELIASGTDSLYDVNGDNVVDTNDLSFHVQTILGTNFGDTDLDGDVDLSDLSNLAANYGGSPKGWAQGNFDMDTDVDLNDLSMLATYYGLGEAQAMADFQALNVPEPAAVSLLTIVAMPLFRSR